MTRTVSKVALGGYGAQRNGPNIMTPSPDQCPMTPERGEATFAKAKKNLHEWFGAPPVILAGERVDVIHRYQGLHEPMFRVRTMSGHTGDWTAACFKDAPR